MMFISRIAVLVSVVAALIAPAVGFAVVSNTKKASSTSLCGFGGAFKNAFANDDSLGKAENAGLKGVCRYNELRI